MAKIIALDLDGTLLNEYGKITEKVKATIDQLKTEHHFLVIASGRTYAEIIRIVQPLGLMEYDRAFLIAYNGVLTVRTFPFTVLMQKTLHRDDVRAIAAELVPRGFKLHVYAVGKLYLSDDIVTYLVPDPAEQKPVVRLSMADYDRYDDVYKVLVLDDAERLEALRGMLPTSFQKRFATFKSWDRLLEFVHVDGSKGAALKNLASILSVPREDVIAIGDEENDISMIAAAGVGIAMGNAKPAVKAAAVHITLSNRFDGVAAAIETFVFAKERGNDDV